MEKFLELKKILEFSLSPIKMNILRVNLQEVKSLGERLLVSQKCQH